MECMRHVETLRADGSGAVTWIAVLETTPVPWIRAFDAGGAFLGEERPAAPVAYYHIIKPK